MRLFEIGMSTARAAHTYRTPSSNWTGICFAHSQSSTITVLRSVSLLEGHVSEVQRVVFTQIHQTGAQQPVSDPPKANVIPAAWYHPKTRFVWLSCKKVFAKKTLKKRDQEWRTSREKLRNLVSSKQVTFMALMSTSVCTLAKTLTSPSLLTFWVFHTTTIYYKKKVKKWKGLKRWQDKWEKVMFCPQEYQQAPAILKRQGVVKPVSQFYKQDIVR